MRIEIEGKHNTLSRQEIRALFHASMTVLEYHNQFPARSVDILFVKILPKSFGKNDITGGKNAGTARTDTDAAFIKMKGNGDFSSAATLILHEVIHIWTDFEHHNHEKLTSTLTARLKADVVRLANILVENTQQRAAYIAHTKLSYRTADEADDRYDPEQYHEEHEDSRGKKYRRDEGRQIIARMMSKVGQ